jgi:3-oxoacyl-[acyl-carrier protein] reductase
VVAEITAAGGEALAVQMDVAEAGQIKAGFKQLSERFARLDILVNNAAITRDMLALRMKLEDWDAVLRTNLTGAYLCTQQAIGVMLRQRYGRIINVSSVVAETGNAGQANYVAAKAGLIGLTRAIAVEIASRSITVNAVAPGFIATPMTDGLVQPVKDAMLARIPLGRMGTDAEIASAIVFLASEQAGYITGHVLDVNGGLHMG